MAIDTRVLIVYPRLRIFGGAELVIVRFCEYLRECLVPHAVLTAEISPEIERALAPSRVLLEAFPPDNHSVLRFGAFLTRQVRKHQQDYDVINVHNFPAELSALVTRKPVVWMCNEPEPFLRLAAGGSWKFRVAFRLWCFLERLAARHFIARSIVADRFNQERFQRLFGREPAIVPYGIDHSFFTQAEDGSPRHQRGWDKRFIVLHVGWIQPFKNQLRSLEILEALRKEIPGMLVVFAGTWEPEYKAALDEFITRHHLGDQVCFTGHVSRTELRRYFSMADVVLHPVQAQGGWLTPFEAMSAGKVVVVSPHLTVSPMIASTGTGVVTEQYVEVLREIHRHPERFAALGERGRIWVRENLTWNHFSEGLLRHLQEAAHLKAQVNRGDPA